MIRLLYFSTANVGTEQKAVAEIVAHSKTNNAARDISGALAYNGRNFCQCLEGPEESVRALMSVIEKDERHSGVKVIDEKRIDTRVFEGWDMRLVEGLDFSVVINAMSA